MFIYKFKVIYLYVKMHIYILFGVSGQTEQQRRGAITQTGGGGTKTRRTAAQCPSLRTARTAQRAPHRALRSRNASRKGQKGIAQTLFSHIPNRYTNIQKIQNIQNVQE